MEVEVVIKKKKIPVSCVTYLLKYKINKNC